MVFRIFAAFLFVCLQGGVAGAAITWSTKTGWGPKDIIFPSTVIALATTKMKISPFFVTMSDVPAGTHVKILVKCPHLFAASTKAFTTQKYNSQLAANIQVNWRFSRLDHVTQEVPVDVVYTVYANGIKLGTQTDTATVHSINACPTFIVENTHGKTVPVDMRFLFSAYVNENAPILDSILKKALKTRMVNQFDGYHSDSVGVVRQVCAIWLSLEGQGIKYSDIAKPPQSLTGIYYQHVRFVDQSFAAAQANCVDGSVLFASLLEHIGIDCGLVIKPGHMFLKFYTAPNHKYPVCLETTMLGSHAAINPRLVNPVKSAFHWWELRAHPFEAAAQYGDFEYNQLVAAEKKLPAKMTQPGLQSAKIIDIATVRKMGIDPIPDPYFKGHDRN